MPALLYQEPVSFKETGSCFYSSGRSRKILMILKWFIRFRNQVDCSSAGDTMLGRVLGPVHLKI